MIQATCLHVHESIEVSTITKDIS